MAKKKSAKQKRLKPAPGSSRSGIPRRTSKDEPGGNPSAPADPNALYDSETWDQLRQGARNASGVRYQIAVTAFLLAASRAGTMPFAELTPEGYEDIDCLDNSGDRWFVQVKELGAGAGRFTAAPFVDALLHAAEAVPARSRIVVVTDGSLGSELSAGGLTNPVAAAQGLGATNALSILAERGLDPTEADLLLQRAHLLHLPWNLASETTSILAEQFGLERAVASVVYATLVEDLSEATAEQRTTSPESRVRRTLGDLEGAVTAALEVIDQTSLSEAVTLGIAAPANYGASSAVTREQFLMGVDADPSHIGCDYDVIRARKLLEIDNGLQEQRYVLLSGPSGSGKSTLLWRAARNRSRGARVVRVLRVQSGDIEPLHRYVRLQAPSDASPVVVVCDDLGRPPTSGWPDAVRRLLEIPNVEVLGASRAEDLTPDHMRHGGVLVNLSLETDDVELIAQQLLAAGVPLTMELEEAVTRADGQLLELIALLTTGKRLRAVLSSQVHALRAPDRAGQLRLARLICAADLLGVSLPAESVGPGADVEASELPASLDRLRGEHIVVADRDAWSGLHQRRSGEISSLIHDVPPPSLETTFAAVADSVDISALGWVVGRATEELGRDSEELAESVRGRSRTIGTATELAILVEFLERADHALTAIQYVPILERHSKPEISIRQLAFRVLGNKLGGVEFKDTGTPLLDRTFRALRSCAEELPDRSLSTALRYGAQSPRNESSIF